MVCSILGMNIAGTCSQRWASRIVNGELLLSCCIGFYKHFGVANCFTFWNNGFHVQHYNDLAVLDKAADVVDELDNGALGDVAGVDAVVELGGDHGVVAGDAVGEEEAVALLVGADEVDLHHLYQRLRVHVASDYSRDRPRRQVHRHRARAHTHTQRPVLV